MDVLADLLELLRSDRWIVEVFLTVFATLVAAWLVRRLIDRLEARIGASQNLYDDAVLHAARHPLRWLMLLLGLSHAATLAGVRSDVELFAYVPLVRELGIILLIAMFGVRLVRFVEDHIVVGDYGERTMDATTATAIGKLLRISIIITAMLTAAQTMGLSISGVLAFGGVGGIAVGFAARDMLANFFGGLMIYLDRPFSVGDWVRSPEKDIEGTVEDIGWRLTRIRTFDQRPIYVPNATFTTIVVENPSRMLNRRIYETIGVRYADVSKLEAITRDVRAMLESHEAIDVNRTLMVNFNGFGASSLDFFVYTFTKTIVWAEFHVIKQDVLLRIAAIIEEHGAEVAFPTRTLHVEPMAQALEAGVADAQPRAERPTPEAAR